MQESLLHYIWRYQKFSKRPLRSLEGKEIKPIHVGNPNSRGGPDFLEVQLYLDGLLWNGAVELHLLASDWYRHGHHLDPQYDSVILHVVWQHDTDVSYAHGGIIPALQLSDYVSSETIEKYQRLFQKKPQFLACESSIQNFSTFKWKHYLDRLFVERMEMRIEEIKMLLSSFKNDWEAVLFVLLFKVFGLNSNGSAFYEAALQTPFHCVRKLQGKLTDIEALFLGQAGLLDGKAVDGYHKELKQHYAYLKTKFKLSYANQKVQFARLRPSNFPTIRLVQLAALYCKNANLFQELLHHIHLDQSYEVLKSSTSLYWKNHYNFGAISTVREKKISRSFFNLIAINTLLPLRFDYSRYLGKSGEEELFLWAQQLPEEQNSIVKRFKSFSVPNYNAANSQGLLHLYKNYCEKRRCLHCNVGYHLMKT
ncbi:MAG: DUF2851 family protein [Flavobacteriaceae bacterium]